MKYPSFDGAQKSTSHFILRPGKFTLRYKGRSTRYYLIAYPNKSEYLSNLYPASRKLYPISMKATYRDNTGFAISNNRNLFI